MRKLIVLSFITLDGVMQAPGGTQEDTTGGFQYGGWVTPFFDEDAGNLMGKQMYPADLLLGRKTFDIFESYWPKHSDDWPGVNEVTKYVLSGSRDKSNWDNTIFLKSVEDIRSLKNSDGRDLQVHGSSELIQLLLQNDLVDELWLKFFPITIGSGKKLFNKGTSPAAFSLTESHVTPGGVIFANYKRNGEIQTGTIGE